MKIFKILSRAILLALLLFYPVYSGASRGINQNFDSAVDDRIYLMEGEVTTLKVYGLTRITLTDPNIIDIIDAQEDEIILVAMIEGSTTLFVWDERGKRGLKFYVHRNDLEDVKDRLTHFLKEANLYEAIVKINWEEGKVVLTGEIPEEKQDLLDEILSNFEEDLLTLAVEKENKNMIQVDMQITELNTTLSETLGVDWGSLSLEYEEELPDNLQGYGNFLTFGKFERNDNLLFTVNALLQQGKGRILSQPRVVVKNNEEASFLVGGEVPIRTTTSTDSGGTQENVQFKEYGVGLTISPRIIDDKVEIDLSVEISEIDLASSSGDDVGFSTRSANTVVLVDDGETVVIAGLIRQQEGETVSKLPFLGDIPVVGMFFRNRVRPADTESEVVIAMTPHIINTGIKPIFRKNEENQAENLAASTRRPIRRVPPMERISLSQEMRQYIQRIQEKISQVTVYPREAERYGWEGTVKVGLHILQDGTLAYALVKESSGYDIIDDYALETAQKAAPYEIFPSSSDLRELNVTIPIVYSLSRK